MAYIDNAAAVTAMEPADADGCFDCGMVYSAGAGVAVDLVEESSVRVGRRSLLRRFGVGASAGIAGALVDRLDERALWSR